MTSTLNLSFSRTPSSRVTDHMRLTTSERIVNRLEAIKFTISQPLRRYFWFATLPNIASALVIFILLFFFIKGKDRELSEYGLVRVDRSVDIIEEFEKRLHYLLEEQEKIKADTYDALDVLKSEMSNTIHSVREDFRSKINEVRVAKNNRCESIASNTSNTISMVEKSFTESIAKVQTELLRVKSSQQPETVKRSFNLASRRRGSVVVESMTSHQYLPGSYLSRMSAYLFSCSMAQWPITDRAIMNPGDAFCFQGPSGKLTIKLSDKSIVNAVEYEHDFWTDVAPVSAPWKYNILACSNNCDDENNFKWRASCMYGPDNNPKTSQTCKLEKSDEKVQMVQMQVEENHGQQYTCLYSLRIFAA